MKTFCRATVLIKTTICLGATMLLVSVAHAQALKVEAQLIWGTDDPQSPDPKHRPIDADLAHRLSNAPYRWKNYFEVNRQVVDVAVGETKTKIPMSKRCLLDIKNLGDNRVEVNLHGDGKPVSSHKESLAKSGMLVLSGDAGNKTAWLVAIRKADPLKKVEVIPAPPRSDSQAAPLTAK